MPGGQRPAPYPYQRPAQQTQQHPRQVGQASRTRVWHGGGVFAEPSAYVPYGNPPGQAPIANGPIAIAGVGIGWSGQESIAGAYVFMAALAAKIRDMQTRIAANENVIRHLLMHEIEANRMIACAKTCIAANENVIRHLLMHEIEANRMIACAKCIRLMHEIEVRDMRVDENPVEPDQTLSPDMPSQGSPKLLTT